MHDLFIFVEQHHKMSGVHALNSLSGVKQGCSLSPTLCGICIDELEQIVVKFVKEEGFEVVIWNVVIMPLLYVDDVVIFCIYFRRCTKAYDHIGRIFYAY